MAISTSWVDALLECEPADRPSANYAVNSEKTNCRSACSKKASLKLSAATISYQRMRFLAACGIRVNFDVVADAQ